MIKYREVSYLEGDCENCSSKDVELFRIFIRYSGPLYVCSCCEKELRD